MDVLRNRSSRLEMVMYLLSIVAAIGGCGCYCVGGARGAQTRWLIIPRSGLQLNLSCFLLDLARNGREVFCHSIAGCRREILYPCWQSNLSPSRSLALYNTGGCFKIRISLWCWTVWLERDTMLVVVARSCWFLDPSCVDGWSIHHTLDIHRCCYFFFVSPVWVGIHFVWIDWVRFMSPQFLLYLFLPFFNNIYIWTPDIDWNLQNIPTLIGLSSAPLLCHWLLPYKKIIGCTV